LWRDIPALKAGFSYVSVCAIILWDGTGTDRLVGLWEKHATGVFHEHLFRDQIQTNCNIGWVV
jgi:hypothetical protein